MTSQHLGSDASYEQGPFLVPLISGPEIYPDVHQPDQVAETGGFAKALFNLTPNPIGWGTSVKEDPGVILAANQVQKFIHFPNAPGFDFAVDEAAFGMNGSVDWRDNQFGIAQKARVPEAGPTWALLAGAAGLLVTLRSQEFFAKP